MNEDLNKASKILTQEGCTCVLCKDAVVYKSHTRGVAPLLKFLDDGVDLKGFSAADKVVGKAPAFLYCLMGVSGVSARVMTRCALQILGDHGIEARYETLCDGILNRKKDGFCPMEMATREIWEPEEALHAIREALEKIQAK